MNVHCGEICFNYVHCQALILRAQAFHSVHCVVLIFIKYISFSYLEMNGNFQDLLSETINLEKDPYLNNLKDVLKLLCRVLIKNFGVFLTLHFYQFRDIFGKSSKLSIYDTDAGDIYQAFRMKFVDAKNNNVYSSILKDDDFSSILLTFSQQLNDFPNIRTFTDQYDSYVEKMWEVCKNLILPVRINPSSINPRERERILRLWLSTAFTLPLLEAYTEKYLGPKSMKIIIGMYKTLKTSDDDRNPSFSITKVNAIISLPTQYIDVYVAPVAPPNNKLAEIFRVYMYLVITASTQIINKPCPNLKQCKEINPNFKGDCIWCMDLYVKDQIQKIENAIRTLTPSI